MTTSLLAVEEVDAAAAGCDFLADRLDPGDSVIVLAVVESDERAVGGEERTNGRDAADALNVAAVRLPGAETERREGDPVEAILATAMEREVDEIVLVSAESSEGDATIEAVRAGADRPVRVAPRT